MTRRVSQWLTHLTVAALTIAFLVSCFTHVGLAAPNSSFVAGVGSTSAITHGNVSQPSYRAVTQDGDYSSYVVRIGGDSSAVILNYQTNSSYPDSVWGRDA